MNSAISASRQHFGRKGYKLTRQRQQVLEVLSGLEGRSISCSEAHELLEKKSYGAGLSTVYRTFFILEELGLLHKVNMDHGCTRYRFGKLTDSHSNMQLICTECGHIIEGYEELIGVMADKILTEKDFVVRDKKIKLYGCCRDCI